MALVFVGWVLKSLIGFVLALLVSVGKVSGTKTLSTRIRSPNPAKPSTLDFRTLSTCHTF